MLQSIITFMMQ